MKKSQNIISIIAFSNNQVNTSKMTFVVGCTKIDLKNLKT